MDHEQIVTVNHYRRWITTLQYLIKKIRSYSARNFIYTSNNFFSIYWISSREWFLYSINTTLTGWRYGCTQIKYTTLSSKESTNNQQKSSPINNYLQWLRTINNNGSILNLLLIMIIGIIIVNNMWRWLIIIICINMLNISCRINILTIFIDVRIFRRWIIHNLS